jgi:leucyl aminopeptidase
LKIDTSIDQSLDFFTISCLNLYQGAGMKTMTRWLCGVFLLSLILLGFGATSGINTAQADDACSIIPIQAISQMLDQTSQDQWLTYLQELTGESVVTISNQLHTITNRNTSKLFNNSVDALAFYYVEEQLSAMQYPPNTIVGHFGYLEHDYSYNGNNWQNLILTIPGQDQVDRKSLILSAHLDDLPGGIAPGAEDNGVGAAALLEIARVLRNYQFDATIKLIWFTGEEQGLRGSQEYLLDYGIFSDDLIGVINLDMFGYDSDDDDCFEIHAGTLPKSYVLGDCLIKTIDAYSLPLTYDYIKADLPEALSDHRPFWDNEFGAIEILENHFSLQATDDYQQCGEDADANPYYHTSSDTIANSIDVPLAFNLVKASLATAGTISEPLGACFDSRPVLSLQSSVPTVKLYWQTMGTLITYRLYRSVSGCGGPWQELADNLYTDHYFDAPINAPDLAYQLEAIAPTGMCYSLPSNCVTVIPMHWTYFPVTVR